MPHINRIRVNNVKYNFGTQSYDDFVMRLSGKNTIYDLANGGGKSILMLLLLQNMIPNCTLDEKQPIEKLFRAGNDNKTIHSLVEWKLNPADVKNGFQYMTTGFCARKAKETADEEGNHRDTAPIEYFNYCVFYQEANPNDIVNLPLSTGDERITYQGLKNYLRDLGKKDYSLQVHIFDRKGDYQRFISRYGIFESEWELVRGINKTEGHVRTFFETHYKTTRKVVEDLFIEEIIEKSFKDKSEQEEENGGIAKTLLDIKDKLVELAKKKGEMEHFDHQMEALTLFSDRLHGLQGLYHDKAKIEELLVKTYHTTKKQKSQLEAAQEETQKSMQQVKERLSTIEKDVERGKIQIEETWLADLAAEVTRLKEENQRLEADAQQKERALSIAEAGNDYFEYLENKKQLEIQKNAIFDIMNKNSGLLEELQSLAYQLLQLEEAQRTDVELQQKELLAQEKELSAQGEVLDVQIRELEKQQAVSENEEQSLSVLLETYGEELELKRQLTEISLVEEAPAVLSKKKTQYQSLEATVKELEAEKQELSEKQIELKIQHAKQEQQRFLLEEQLEKERKNLADSESAERKRKQMEEIYGETGAELYSCVEQAFESRVAKAASLEIEIADLKSAIENLQQKSFALEDETMQQLLSYIQRHYDDDAVGGAEYVCALSEEERKHLLEKIPFILQSVVMKKNVDAASFDTKLKEKLPMEKNVVLLEESLLKEEEPLFFGSRVHFLGGNCAYLYDEDSRRKELQRLEEEQKEAEKQFGSLQESIIILKEDLFFLNQMLQQGNESVSKQQEKYEELKKSYHQMIEEQEQYTQKKQLLQTQVFEKETELQNAKQQLQQIEKEEQLLEELQKQYQLFIETERKVSATKKHLQQTMTQLSEAQTSRAEVMTQAESVKLKLKSIAEELSVAGQKCQRYEAYRTEKTYPMLNMKKEELEQIFLGKQIAFEEKNGDVSDKQRMAEIYQASMEKNEQAIRYRQLSIEELEKLAEQHELARHSIEELEKEKEALHRAKQRLSDASKEYAHKQSQYDRQQGSIQHGRNAYEEKFEESYMPLEMEAATVQQLQRFVQENGLRLKEIKKEEESFEQKLRLQEKQLSTFEVMEQELQRLIENSEIIVSLYEGCLEEGESLAQVYKQVRKDYEQLAKQEQRCRESFEQDKAKLVETLHLLESKDLAEEITKQLTNPKSIQQVEQYIQQIGQTIDCIKLEKSRIGQSIENMEIVKDNFERQCLQTCLTIKDALERLPKLSSIMLDGETINMVQLQIPYIEESLYKDAIGRYIDRIVETADQFKTQLERLKYIRSQLAWKRLFSVIVKDMDKIRLQLYKRERMKEQSRYLKYEEAVGSTGQSQGIYIQFLVAVINYIASMNSHQADASMLKKVIFIDNPFGAAKDVYIWEPIFAMLKSNHVQLIVPARGVTPAITGRFEINYLLGQKLINGRQQTVVVDYRSQVKEEFLEYKKLEFSQETFEFV